MFCFLLIVMISSPIHCDKDVSWSSHHAASKNDSELITSMVNEYFTIRKVNIVTIFSCFPTKDTVTLSKTMAAYGVRTTVLDLQDLQADENMSDDTIEKYLSLKFGDVGIFLDFSCDRSDAILKKASRMEMFNSTHKWLIFDLSSTSDNSPALRALKSKNLTLDSDVSVICQNEEENNRLSLFSVYNTYSYYKFGGDFKVKEIGRGNTEFGEANISLLTSAMRGRNDFEGITLRAVAVTPVSPDINLQEDLIDSQINGLSRVTQVNVILSNILSELYNFSIKYTKVDIWAGEKNNSVMYNLRRKAADFACGIRCNIDRMTDMDCIQVTWMFRAIMFFRNPSNIESLGQSTCRFVVPLSWGSWIAVLSCGLLLTIVTTFSLICQIRRKRYRVLNCLNDVGVALHDGTLSVIASFCQQGTTIRLDMMSSRMATLVTLLFSILVYNYYTSSVLYTLLSPPNIPRLTLMDLTESPLEVTFEDIGYTRSLIEDPNFSFHQLKAEKLMVKKKVETRKRTKPVYLKPEDGIALVKVGGFAYQTEMETGYPLIATTFDNDEICDLQELYMDSEPVFMTSTKNSPLREKFSVGLVKLAETGLMRRVHTRVKVTPLICSKHNSKPKPVPVSRVLPLLVVVGFGGILSLIALFIEINYARFFGRK